MGSNNSKVLGLPNKSPNDSCFYQVIELHNGLKVIVISDVNQCPACKVKYASHSQNEMEEKIRIFNKNHLKIPQKSTQNKEPKCICEDYVGEVVLSVGGGSWDDPKEMEGLAHFCEHVLFCGSSTTTPNQLDNFLLECGSDRSVASTFGKETLFGFCAVQSQIEKTLELFCNLFKNPQLEMNCFCSELSAVDYEFETGKCCNYEVIHRVRQSTGNPNHPATFFSHGNLGSLNSSINSLENLRKKVREFWEKHYDARNMILAIKLSKNHYAIEDLVVKHFASFPNRNRKNEMNENIQNKDKNCDDSDLLPFSTQEFRSFYYIVPPIDTDSLTVTWELPASGMNYLTKPIEYIGKSLVKCSPGGLLYYLSHQKDICSNIIYNVDDFEPGSNFCLFSLTFDLIKCSDEKSTLDEVLFALFSYLSFLQENGINEETHLERNKQSAVFFHFLAKKETRQVWNLARALRQTPPSEIITSRHFSLKYCETSIRKILQCLVPQNANYIFASRSFLNEREHLEKFFKTEKYYGTPYLRVHDCI